MYKSQFCEVNYLQEINVVFVKWKKFCKGNDYREPLLYAIEEMKKYDNCHYVADTRDGFENEDEDTEWVFTEFAPKASAAGCRYIFFIISPENNLKEELEGQSVELKKYFKVIACFDFAEVGKVIKDAHLEALLKENNTKSVRVVLDYVNAINAADISRLYDLMTNDHLFIDSRDNRVIGRDEMKKAWIGYFSMFPDYKIEIDKIVEKDSFVCLLGYASGTYKSLKNSENSNCWRVPAAWTTIVRDDKLKQWQVYADNTLAIEIYNRNENVSCGDK